METLVARNFAGGREFVGRMPKDQDIVATIEDFCARNAIMSGAVSLIGAASSATLGTYDQKQQVYVTFKKEGHLEILSCLGNISLKDEKPFLHAHIILADEAGNAMGGHLFSETICFAGEIYIRELTGATLERNYDEATGLMLWDMAADNAEAARQT